MITIVGVIHRRLRKGTRCPPLLIPDYVLLGVNREGVVMSSLRGYRVTSLVAGYTVVSYFQKHYLWCRVPVKW